MCAPQIAIYVEQMATQMASFRCSKCSMTLLAMLIRVVENVEVPSRFIWNLGMLMFMIIFNFVKIMAKKNIELETYSTLYGSPIFS